MKRVLIAVALAVLAASSMPAPGTAAEYRRLGPVIGKRQVYWIRAEDSLPEVGRRYDLGYGEITATNRDVDPFVPELGRKIVLPTEWILPDAPIRSGIIVNLAEMRLFLLSPRGRNRVTTYPVGIGDRGTETPLGRFSIVEKIKDPAWHVPESIRKKEPDLPAVFPPGPDNPMGSRALRLSNPTVLIHGTDRPWGIGSRNSHGCIRLYEEDITRLFQEVEIGTAVAVVDQPVKAAAKGSRVFLEIHDDGSGRDLGWETRNLLRAKGLEERIDPGKMQKAIAERSGLVVDVTKRITAR